MSIFADFANRVRDLVTRRTDPPDKAWFTSRSRLAYTEVTFLQ